ncbi:cytochrome P450 [Exidia glandulosa HHB12029]|uniref:Cytochrome P450 n=1 Tax=Exidia glandulosa HHB12029 TaxID=1314781 RepID=A0A165Q0T6_EXIGL|nr:cytochrome P450 [Exidia glandulosa HHB12029]
MGNNSTVAGFLLPVQSELLSTIVAPTGHYRHKPQSFPEVGSAGGPLASWRSGYKAVKATRELLLEGYSKFGRHGTIFKLPSLGRPVLIVSSPEHIEDMRKAPDEVLSFRGAVEDTLQTQYMFDTKILEESRFHITIIRSILSRQLSFVFPEIFEEISQAFQEYIPAREGAEWTTVPAFGIMTKIVARTTSRLFVGEPLCREPSYLDLIIRYTSVLASSSRVISLFPPFVKPLVARFLTPLPTTYKKAVYHLEPIVEQHKALLKEHGRDWADKPNDLITWILETASGPDLETPAIIKRILRFNFAAIHTTSMTFTFALFHLAAEEAKYLQPLRSEIEAIVEREGWSKASIDKMKHLDSFIRESHRMHGLGATSMTRKAMVDFTFSDGTKVPKGTHISVASMPRHLDDNMYQNATQFEGFRFVLEGEADDNISQNRFVSISPDYLPFGLGRPACPGRFWAANEMKTMFAYLIYHYDLKMEREGELPEPEWFGAASIPSRSASIMLRRRTTAA